MAEPVILLVEDNPADVKLTRRALQKAGVKATLDVAEDGVEALDYLLGEGDRPARGHPSVVLLDLNLPRIDGHQVLQRIRREPRTRRLPVVVLTSSGEESDVVRSYDGGVNSYVRKPVDFESFVEATRHLGAYWLGLNYPPPPPRDLP